MDNDSQKTCANCGIKLRGTGPRSSVLAERFCMAPACQTIKQRRYRSQLKHSTPVAPIDARPCFNCGVDLAPRPPRVTDTEVGRWCPAARCQQDRATRMKLVATAADMRAGLPVSMDMTEMRRIAARLMREKAEQSGRVACPECGRLDAIPAYGHPTPYRSETCRSLGNFPSTPDDFRHFFPDTMGEDAG